MKAVYLVMHQSRPNVKELAKQIVTAFEDVNIAVACEPWLAEYMQNESVPFLREGGAYDAVISVGGDGTFLRANQFAAEQGLPLLGVNVGRVGFLAEVELDQLSQACRDLKAGNYSIESRMMLEGICEDTKLLALNDIVVSRAGYARLIAVKVWVDHELVGRYIADGLIVSSPTGSTAYSLSAGGPIVFPGVDCMILSPICAHSLQHRPVVLSSQQTVTLELDCELQQKAQLTSDGQEAFFLSANQKVVITRSCAQARLIHFHSQDFFSLIRRKLSEWSC